MAISSGLSTNVVISKRKCTLYILEHLGKSCSQLRDRTMDSNVKLLSVARKPLPKLTRLNTFHKTKYSTITRTYVLLAAVSVINKF